MNRFELSVDAVSAHYQSNYILLCGNELSIVFDSYAITVVGGDANDAPDFGMVSAGCALCHTFTCAKARLSTRVCLANCSYHSPAAGNGGMRHPMACSYQSGGYSIAVTLAAL